MTNFNGKIMTINCFFFGHPVFKQTQLDVIAFQHVSGELKLAVKLISGQGRGDRSTPSKQQRRQPCFDQSAMEGPEEKTRVLLPKIFSYVTFKSLLSLNT
jgi:hypothetical protein